MNDYLIYTGVLNLGYAVFNKVGSSSRRNTKKSFDMKVLLVGQLRQDMEANLEKEVVSDEEKSFLCKLYSEAELYIVKICTEGRLTCLNFTKHVKSISIKCALACAVLSGFLLFLNYEFTGVFYLLYLFFLLPFLSIITLPYLYNQFMLYILTKQSNAIMEFVSNKHISTVIRDTAVVSVKEF